MKVFFRRVHLYLGLAAGLVITTSCLTGSLLVFEKELTEAFNHDRYYIKPVGMKMSLNQITALVKQQAPSEKVSRIQVYADPARTLQVWLEKEQKGDAHKDGRALLKEGAFNKKEVKEDRRRSAPANKKKQGRTAFVNPYTGKIVAFYNYQQTFFYEIFALHRWLLAGATGKVITGISTLIFLFILTTGIILWWPKTHRILKQRLKIKWKAGWKRLNHDMHLVLGFYAAIFLFIFAFTGLTWSFEWFNNGLYAILRTSPKAPPAPSSATTLLTNKGTITYDAVLAQVKQQVPDAVYYSLMAPKDSTAAFVINLLPAAALHEGATTSYYVDQFSGNVLRSQTFAQKNLGQKIRGTIKPLHTGAIFGIPSKIVALLIALLGVTFPVTGTIMWINRTMKKKKRTLYPTEKASRQQIA